MSAPSPDAFLEDKAPCRALLMEVSVVTFAEVAPEGAMSLARWRAARSSACFDVPACASVVILIWHVNAVIHGIRCMMGHTAGDYRMLVSLPQCENQTLCTPRASSDTAATRRSDTRSHAPQLGHSAHYRRHPHHAPHD